MAPKKEEEAEKEYVVEPVRDHILSSRGSRLSLLARECGTRWGSSRHGSSSALQRYDCSLPAHNDIHEWFIIAPDSRWYQLWVYVILLWAVYSSFITPIEFGFFRGIPTSLYALEIGGQVAFLLDIVIHFFVAYHDGHKCSLVSSPSKIALRYIKGSFAVDLLGCLPWEVIYKASGRKEIVRYLLWIRLARLRKVSDFFQKLEKDIRINYLFTRIVKLIAVELYCAHTAACIFYYLATTYPPDMEGYTWIGSLTLGNYSYHNFRDLDLWRRYMTSLYWAIVTMATVGYGDVSAVNTREMAFIVMFVSCDMVLGAYLIGNMTALIVKGSRTERFRDKMTDLTRYMNRNRLGKGIRDEIKRHVYLQYESNYTDTSILQEFPWSVRAKISEALYKKDIENVPLFEGCSPEFINQIVIRLHEEFFLPGELILEQGDAVDQLYFVCHGILEGIDIGEDGTDETVLTLKKNSSFGEVAVICNIPQPYTIKVLQLCRLLRLDKQSFKNVLQIYFSDCQIILKNLQEMNTVNVIKQLESDISFHIGKHENELAVKVNSAAYYGDFFQLRSLIRSGADPNKTDYTGRSPLHLAASKGYEEMTLFLLHEGVDIDKPDKFGNTPLLEAIKNGHDGVAALLVSRGASLDMDDLGSRLCGAVGKGDVDFVKMLLSLSIDPNVRDYDHRTPLHVAASHGLYAVAKLLLDAGALVSLEDRWGHTPIDEAHRCGSKQLVTLLEQAKASQLSNTPGHSEHVQGKVHGRKCTVFPFHPWSPSEKRREGVVLWIPRTMDELVEACHKHFSCSCSLLLTEEGGQILDVDMITDGQKLYLVSHTQSVGD